MKLTAQGGAVNHGKPEKRTLPFLLAEDVVVALLARHSVVTNHTNFFIARGR
jgi:hypothetical protein